MHMGLDGDSKKLLENEIEEALHGLPASMALARQDTMKELFGIDNDGDFAIGYAIGQIIRLLQIDIVQRYDRKPDEGENEEITEAIWKRVDDFREVIRKWK